MLHLCLCTHKNLHLSPILSKSSVSGSFTSLQNDATICKISWIISGVYKMNKINTPNPTFNGSFYMIRTDGTQPHKHTISDFRITGKPVVANNSTTFNGTSTVTMNVFLPFLIFIPKSKDLGEKIYISSRSSVSSSSSIDLNHFTTPL